MRIGNLFASADECEFAQWERGGCGMTLRLGSWLFAIGHLDYREKSCPWPRWLRFGVSIGGPANESMSGRRVHYLYLCGRRVFDTLYWQHRDVYVGVGAPPEEG